MEAACSRTNGSQSILRVLLFGLDPSLVETRSLVLGKAGFSVQGVASSVELEQKLAEDRPDVLVLCHTLPAEERERAEARVRRTEALIKVLQLDPRMATGAAQGTATLATISPDPANLIRMVQQMARPEPACSKENKTN